MKIGNMIELLQQGKKTARNEWNGENQFLKMQLPDENSKMQRPYVYISPVDGKLVPWLPSQSDLLAEDWHEVQEEKRLMGFFEAIINLKDDMKMCHEGWPSGSYIVSNSSLTALVLIGGEVKGKHWSPSNAQIRSKEWTISKLEEHEGKT